MKYDDMATPTKRKAAPMTEQPDIRQWPEHLTAPYWGSDHDHENIQPMQRPTAYSRYLDDQIARLTHQVTTDLVVWRARELNNQRAALIAARVALALLEQDPAPFLAFTLETDGVFEGFDVHTTSDSYSAARDSFRAHGDADRILIRGIVHLRAGTISEELTLNNDPERQSPNERDPDEPPYVDQY